MVSLFQVLVASALSHLGGLMGGFLLIWQERLAHRFSKLFISFAAGALLAVALLDLLPEAVGQSGEPTTVFAYALFGILLFFIVEKFLVWHQHEHDDGDHEGQLEVHAPVSGRGTAIRPLVLLGDGLHNLLDGAAIAVTYLVDPALGTATAISVLFHELPHNLSDFSILLHTKMRRSRVVLANVLLAFASPLGALIAYYAASRVERLLLPLLAVAAGSFLYLALADLLPELQHERRLNRIFGQVVLLLLGVAVMWYVGVLFPERT